MSGALEKIEVARTTVIEELVKIANNTAYHLAALKNNVNFTDTAKCIVDVIANNIEKSNTLGDRLLELNKLKSEYNNIGSSLVSNINSGILHNSTMIHDNTKFNDQSMHSDSYKLCHAVDCIVHEFKDHQKFIETIDEKLAKIIDFSGFDSLVKVDL